MFWRAYETSGLCFVSRHHKFVLRRFHHRIPCRLNQTAKSPGPGARAQVRPDVHRFLYSSTCGKGPSQLLCPPSLYLLASLSHGVDFYIKNLEIMNFSRKLFRNDNLLFIKGIFQKRSRVSVFTFQKRLLNSLTSGRNRGRP